jgi:hypothetical protein
MQNEKAQELKDGLAKLIQALATDTDEARQSTLFTAYLRACGLFHNYSWHNCASIWSQKPEATRVAGYQTWKKLQRYVVAGSKGIAIFAPMTFKDNRHGFGFESCTCSMFRRLPGKRFRRYLPNVRATVRTFASVF